MYAAQIIADSISPTGHRLTTFEVTFPRIVLAEWNTHRVQSRNSASSRAIPVEKRISMIQSDPFLPEAFGKNQKGMQAAEALSGADDERAREIWLAACEDAIRHARALADIGVHKQLANRILEPFAWHTVIATATEWANFFALRCHPNAQPEIRKPAEIMRELYQSATPLPLGEYDWHLPYIRDEDRIELGGRAEQLVKICSARCARVSYLTHDGQRSLAADFELYTKLFSNGHVSPLEHPARSMTQHELAQAAMFEYVVTPTRVSHPTIPQPTAVLRRKLAFTADERQYFRVLSERATHFCGNFNGWVQHRKELPGEAVFSSAPS